ncbi:MAG: hypothetical protein GX682_01150 [Clostridiaceae bacterium]|nr:hypothetical protein [Clostridiaceae bacterium]
MYTIEEFDKEKTKVLKYVIYKKRTEKEIRKKFKSEIDENLLEDIIQNLIENGYISDANYIQRAINEFIALKNLSIKEIKYKLTTKGISNTLIEDYIQNNIDEMEDYEQKSADNIVLKKSVNMNELEIKQYLMKKGYTEEHIKVAMEKIEE